MSSNNKCIGLVLSSVPGYTETFFRNKIKGLQSIGYSVILFVDNGKTNDSNFICKVVSAGIYKGASFKLFYNYIRALFRTLFVHPKRSYMHFKLDKVDGLSRFGCFKNLMLHEHFFNYQLDWLHFGYGMLAHNRENIAQSIGSKMGVSFRGFDLYLSPLKHKNCYERLYRKKITYHVLSNKMKQILIEKSIESDAVHVITPAIDTELFDHKKTQKSKSKINILTVARLHWIKGLEYTLEAMSVLKSNGVPFYYTIVGDGEDIERLVFAANQLNLTDCVNFVEKQTQQKIKNLMQESDIYVQYSIQEGFCNSVLEAQAMGMLCVVSDADGLMENISNGQTGWIVPKRNPEALAKKIQDVIKLPLEEKEVITQQAIMRVKDKFNLNRQLKLFKEFYTS